MLTTFVRDYPDQWYGFCLLGARLRDLSRFDEAERALRTAARLANARALPLVYYDTGDLFSRKGDHAAAEHWFREAIGQSPADAAGYVYLGAMFARCGRLAEAELVHRRGTLCTTGYVEEANYNLGLVLRALGRYAEAIACFDRALQIDPHYKLARVARRDVKRALALSPTPRAGPELVPDGN